MTSLPRQYVRAQHSDVFTSRGGHTSTNGPTQFTVCDQIIDTDKPLLGLLMAAAKSETLVAPKKRTIR